MSLTQPSSGQYSLTYDKYSMMLHNACIRYDKTLKHKPSPTSRAVYQHDTADEDPHIQEEEEDFLDSSHHPGTAHDDMYKINMINSKRSPHAKPLITRKPNEKFKFPKPKPRYNGPVYLPKHIYHRLNEDVKKALDQYNQEKKAQYKPNHSRMAKVHEQDSEGAEDEHDHPEPDLDNHLQEDSYPMQDSDIEELLEYHTPYSVNMASI